MHAAITSADKAFVKMCQHKSGKNKMSVNILTQFIPLKTYYIPIQKLGILNVHVHVP